MRDSGGRFVRGAYTFFVGTAIVLFCLIAATSPATAWQPVNDGKTAGDPCHPPGQKRCGHPINIGTGNVFEEVTDYQTAGPNKLSFTRYYNTRTPNNQSSLFLYLWRSNFDRRLQGNSTYLYALRADGKQLYFVSDGSGGWGFYGGDMDVRLAQSGSTFTLTDWDDNVETYAPDPRPYPFCRDTFCAILTSIKMRNGYTQTLQYDSNYKLISVTDSYGRTLNLTYNAAGFLDTVTTPNGLVLSYSYTAPNIVLAGVNYSTNPPTSLTYLHDPYYYTLVTGIIDENGKRYASWTYDGTGRGTSSQFAGGAELTTLAFNDNANQRTVTNALGQQEVYTFAFSQDNTPKATAISRLATATTAAATRSFTYDSNGYVASETDWNGNQTTYVNDVHGQPVTITEAAGTGRQRVTTISYLANFRLPSQIVTPGLTTSFTYDSSGNLLTRTETDTTTTTVPYSTNGQTRTWTYSWGSNFLPVSVTDPRGNTTQFAWDSAGALTSITNPLGQVTQITQHTADGYPQTIVDPNGIVANLAYDARQRLISRTINTSTGPLTTTYSYDPAGNLTQVTLPDGSALANTYDAAHRLVATADLFGQQIQYALDTLADHTQTSVLTSASTVVGQRSATFDALGRILQSIGGVGQTTTFAYDANGNRTSVSDPLGRVTHQAFDALNRRTQITDPASGVTAIAYDAQDHPVAIIDPNGNVCV